MERGRKPRKAPAAVMAPDEAEKQRARADNRQKAWADIDDLLGGVRQPALPPPEEQKQLPAPKRARGRVTIREQQKALPAPEKQLALPAPEEQKALPAPKRERKPRAPRQHTEAAPRPARERQERPRQAPRSKPRPKQGSGLGRRPAEGGNGPEAFFTALDETPRRGERRHGDAAARRRNLASMRPHDRHESMQALQGRLKREQGKRERIRTALARDIADQKAMQRGDKPMERTRYDDVRSSKNRHFREEKESVLRQADIERQIAALKEGQKGAKRARRK